jgi:hypothetical protein
MRFKLTALLPIAALTGCAGYAADYWRSETSIIGPQLSRYGFTEAQAQCAGRRLTASLSVWQLRQLERIAKLVPANQFGRASLEPRDLAVVAAHVEDRRVAPEVAGTIAECAPPPVPVAAAPAPAPAAAVRSGPAAALWLNLGAAPTGQSIAVDAATIREQSGTREAWFRLTNPGAARPSENSYLLRVDCTARTINSMAFRRTAPDGTIAEERDYRPAGEGMVPVAGGTVMEIAYLALCT